MIALPRALQNAIGGRYRENHGGAHFLCQLGTHGLSTFLCILQFAQEEYQTLLPFEVDGLQRGERACPPGIEKSISSNWSSLSKSSSESGSHRTA